MSIDRDALLAALDALGGEDDQTVLSAARAAAAMMDQAALEWEEVLVERLPGTVASSAPAIEVGEDDASIRSAIEAMLARPALHDGTREDLEDFMRELEAGELAQEDRTYIAALYQRLQD
ncbi:MAG: hypothetical protein P1U49_14305 [Minwuia sp.]|nr:hypothetical protein [Minwuia sp.]